MKVFDPQKHDFRPEDKKKEKKPRADPDRCESLEGPLDEALEDTFPASDPPAITTPSQENPCN